MTAISTCLWFDGQAEEAANLYVSLLPDSRIDGVSRYGQDMPGGKKGDALMVEFTLARRPHLALNGGPMYRHTPAMSLLVSCEDQAEVDRLWDTLADGGKEMRCGWLTDRFGVTWQIVPKVLGTLMKDPDPAKAGRVAKAMMGMVRFDVAALMRASEGASA